jgi:hypothetical protein
VNAASRAHKRLFGPWLGGLYREASAAKTGIAAIFSASRSPQRIP